jgi:hypothetical protein
LQPLTEVDMLKAMLVCCHQPTDTSKRFETKPRNDLLRR